MIAALVDHLWQSSLFCAAVWLISFLFRANGAGIRHSLWMLASVKFLVPFSALYLLGAVAGLPTPVETRPLLLSDALAAATPVISPAIVLRDAAATPVLPALLLTIWFVGAAVVAWRWFTGWRAANSLTWATRPAPDTPLDVRVTDADVEPSVARVFNPVVLLPAALLRRLEPSQLRAVLAHEHEHIARQDNLKAHVHRLVETLFWFFPPVWWIGRRLVDERERACDEAVLAHGHDPADYAAAILAVCRHCCESARHAQAPSALDGDLTTRIRLILRAAPPASVGFVKSLGLALCLMTAATVPLFAGALDGNVHRRALIAHNMRMLDDAIITVAPSPISAPSFDAAGRIVSIRGATLRELVAFAYDIRPSQVYGGGKWLDDGRYDIRAEAATGLNEPDEFDPIALRGMVNKLLASRFDLTIQVNQRCEQPCGSR